MPPPRKRPRLHFIGSSSPEPDVELATARSQNDRLLKTRWESVFQRYEKDFTGIGDEIGIISGEVEVDNGHLRSMQIEKDIGETPASPSKFDGRRMLRAMTVAPTEYSESIPDADEVLQSIETIADNAMLSDYFSEDDLFDTHTGAGAEAEDELSQDYLAEQHEYQDVPSDTSDDLFKNRPIMRSLSVDSLFASRPQDEIPTTAKEMSLVPDFVPNTAITSQSQIQDKTETTIREQVRRILQEEKEQEKQVEEEKIEPAWRLPLRLPSLPHSCPVSASLPRIASTDHSPAEVDDELDLDQERRTSVWNTSARPRRSRREVAAERNLKRIRAESEDPLQEGFSSESEESASQPTVESPLPPSSRAVAMERLSRPSSRSVTAERPSQPSGRSSTRLPTQPSSTTEPATSHGYSTRHALGRRSSRRHRQKSSPLQDAVQSPAQHPPSVSGITIGRTTSVEVPACRQTGHQKELRGPPSPAAAATYGAENQTRHGRNKAKHQLKPSASLSNALVTSAKEGVVAKQTEDTIIINPVRPSDDVSDSQSDHRQPNSQRTPRTYHPWEIGTSRSGNPMTSLLKALRRRACQEYNKDLFKHSPATKLILHNGSIITTFAEIEKMDVALAEVERQKILQPMRNGICVYCNANYQDFYSTGSHWDRILTSFVAEALGDDDPHDMEFIHSVRSKIERRTRTPQTLLRDFRLIVELHEGSGLTFQQIRDSKLLHTNKHPSKLEKEYPTYRGGQEANAIDPWPKELEERLWREVEKADDNTSMASLRRLLVGNNVDEMSMLDLGNKLAERFLEEYRARNDAFGDQLQMYGGESGVQRPNLSESGYGKVHRYAKKDKQHGWNLSARRVRKGVGTRPNVLSMAVDQPAVSQQISHKPNLNP